MLRLDSRHIWAPHIFEKTLLRRGIESQITSGVAVDDTKIVVQGVPNNVIRHVAHTMDLESESRVDLPIPDTTFQRFDFLWSSRNCSRIQSTLFGRQLVEPLREFHDEVVAL